MFSFVFVSASCQEEQSGKAKEPPREQFPPVETKDPNTSYKPAFEGQTRIEGVKTRTPYEVKIIADGLSNPWAVTSLTDGRLVITEKGGTMRIATTAGELSDPITGFPEVDNRNQGGLLDVAPAPDFEISRMLYFTFAEKTYQGSLTAVGKGTLSTDEKQIENFQVIFRAIPYFDNSMHFGSRIVFDIKGNIFVSTGERSDLATQDQKLRYLTMDTVRLFTSQLKERLSLGIHSSIFKVHYPKYIRMDTEILKV